MIYDYGDEIEQKDFQKVIAQVGMAQGLAKTPKN